MNSSILSNWKSPFIILGVSEWFYLHHFYRNRFIYPANSVDPDETPRHVASHLGRLHCLPESHLWNTRHKWVKWFQAVIFFHFDIGGNSNHNLKKKKRKKKRPLKRAVYLSCNNSRRQKLYVWQICYALSCCTSW